MTPPGGAARSASPSLLITSFVLGGPGGTNTGTRVTRSNMTMRESDPLVSMANTDVVTMASRRRLRTVAGGLACAALTAAVALFSRGEQHSTEATMAADLAAAILPAAAPLPAEAESPSSTAEEEEESSSSTRHVVFVYVDDQVRRALSVFCFYTPVPWAWVAAFAVGRRCNSVRASICGQGFNDLGSQSTDLAALTPVINELSLGGVWLTRYYGMHICTPSRAALLTGKHPIHTGMSHSMITGTSPWGLPLEHALLPTVLKHADARTKAHMVGKWHLGFFAQGYVPTNRGFDTFFGFYTGYEDYFTHVAEMTQCDVGGDCYYDLHDGATPVGVGASGADTNHAAAVADSSGAAGKYNVDLFNARAEQLIVEHEPSVPLFLCVVTGS